MWALLIFSLLLLFGGLGTLIVTGSLFWQVVGLLMLGSIISTLHGKGVLSGKKDAAL